MNKYIIVNAETIKQRINDLEKQYLKESNYNNRNSRMMGELESELRTLKQILSNSKPLEEELSKAFSAGMSYGIEQSIDYEKESPQPDLKTYINNLKLDI